MGEEYGEEAPFPFFISHSDADLIEAVRRGRSAEFARFRWQGEVPDPQAETTFLASKLHWEQRGQGQHGVLRDYYREQLRLRREHPALVNLSTDHLEATAHPQTAVLTLHRWSDTAQALLVLHFSNEPRSAMLPLPAGTWHKRLDSAERRWHGPGSSWPEVLTSPGQLHVELAAWQVVLLER
jgi:maltooligosyltrehalose trehalohydrolase